MSEKQIVGQVVALDGAPAAGVEVSPYWIAETGRMQPWQGVKTDAAGNFAMTVAWYDRPIALMAMDDAQEWGGCVVLEEASLDRPVSLRLEPLVHVHGAFTCEAFGERPEWTNVYLNLLPEKVRVAECSSEEAAFSLKMPPGHYQFWGYGTDVQDRYLDLTLQSDNPDVDLQTVNLEPTLLAQHYGKEPPEWHITAARGLNAETRLSDFKGKWIVLEFWASYCGPCIYQSLPALMEFHEKHAPRDEVQILAFHKHNIKTFEELEAELEPIIREVWHGKTLPFPILLDATRQTIANFGISYYPTAVFIDPEGKVAKGLDLKALEARLEAERKP